ncbi:unnamed protein product [Paramecium octaurelia]|uniref:Mitochondrial import inner membrane translocase subunit TIM50 n=1 Tax=Paramecium octaurelia TaxID=43137 RepID=A0A8S1WBU0_PAROT|nr:unnamed protein product [Paramecium octaurelia]
MQNLKSFTPRQEVKPVKVNITTEQFQALTKMYNLGKLQTKNAERELIQQHLQQQQLIQTSTQRNNTPQSCKSAQEMKYFLYQKNNGKEQQVKIQNNSQVQQKPKNSLHRNFSQIEKSGSPILPSKIQPQVTSQQKVKKYNPLSIDQRFTSNQQFVQQITSQINKKEDPPKKDNLKVSLDDFVTQINKPAKSLISPFKQTKSLSPSSRIQSSKQKKYIYYVTSVIETFKHQYSQTIEQQLYKDHAMQTFNCIGFCLNLQDPDPQILRLKELNLPLKQNCKYKKTVVFDLDETLIHCNENQTLKADIYIPIKFPSGDVVSAGINIRPYAKWILTELSKLCEVIVFTASHQCYASQVIAHLDPNNQFLSAQVFRDGCVLSTEGVHIKDLRIFKRDLKDIVLVDNAAYSFGMHLENGIPIIPYYDNQEDKELKFLYDFLVEQVLPAPDCRLVLQSTFKLREFSKYRDPKTAIEKLF